MSQLERLREDKGRSQSKGKNGGKTVTGLYTYHPSENHRKSPIFSSMSLQMAMGIVASRLELGCNLSLGFKPENESYFWIIRVKSSDWQTAPAVSVFHSLPERAMIGLAYYLQEVNPDWPHTQATFLPLDNQW